MFTVEDIRKEYDRLDKMLGVDTKGIKLSISGRLSSKLGYFQVKNLKKFLGIVSGCELCITIAKGICEDETQFYDTIRHEYAHAVVFLKTGELKHGHDRLWKNVCRQVGCEAKAKSAVKSTDTIKKLYKYELRCKSCGAKYYYKKKCSTVKIALGEFKGPRISCSSCRGQSFNVFELNS